VDGETVFEADFHFAEVGRLLEEIAFGFGRGCLCPRAFEAWGALTLLPMMVREQDPFDALDTNLLQMVEHAAVAKVDQQRSFAIPQDIDVAGVPPDEEVRSKTWVNWYEVGRGGREAEPRQYCSQ
jgi:hypothetical protein